MLVHTASGTQSVGEWPGCGLAGYFAGGDRPALLLMTHEAGDTGPLALSGPLRHTPTAALRQPACLYPAPGAPPSGGTSRTAHLAVNTSRAPGLVTRPHRASPARSRPLQATSGRRPSGSPSSSGQTSRLRAAASSSRRTASCWPSPHDSSAISFASCTAAAAAPPPTSPSPSAAAPCSAPRWAPAPLTPTSASPTPAPCPLAWTR